MPTLVCAKPSFFARRDAKGSGLRLAADDAAALTGLHERAAEAPRGDGVEADDVIITLACVGEREAWRRGDGVG